MAQCCCGKYKNLSLKDPEFIHNDVVHQVLGLAGNFCGPKEHHIIKQLEEQNIKLKEKIEELESDPDGRDQIYKQNLKLRTFLIKLEEEVRYVPDNVALWFATLSSRINGVL